VDLAIVPSSKRPRSSIRRPSAHSIASGWDWGLESEILTKAKRRRHVGRTARRSYFLQNARRTSLIRWFRHLKKKYGSPTFGEKGRMRRFSDTALVGGIDPDAREAGTARRCDRAGARRRPHRSRHAVPVRASLRTSRCSGTTTPADDLVRKAESCDVRGRKCCRGRTR